MNGIKCVAQPLDGAAAIAPPPVIEPDEGKAHQCVQFDADAAYAGDTEHRQSRQLDQPVPTGQVKQQNQGHAPAAVVRMADLQQPEGSGKRRRGRQKVQGVRGPLRPVRRPAHQRPGQQRPQDVLVARIQRPAAEGQIEGYLRQHRKQQQPQGVPPPVMGTDAALGDLKGEDGKGDAPHAPQPQDPRKQDVPHMVHQHGGHGDVFQGHGAESGALLRHSAPLLIPGGDGHGPQRQHGSPPQRRRPPRRRAPARRLPGGTGGDGDAPPQSACRR